MLASQNLRKMDVEALVENPLQKKEKHWVRDLISSLWAVGGFVYLGSLRLSIDFYEK